MKARRTTGIFLTRTGGHGAFAWRPGLSRKPRTKIADHDTGTDIWAEDGAPMTRLFRKLALALPGDARRADCPTRIALPDPFVSEERLSFQEFPASRTEAHALVGWRFGNDYRKSPEDHAFAWQVIGASDGRTDVLVRVAEKRFTDRVRRAAAAAGFFCDRIDGWSGFWPATPASGAHAQLWTAQGWWALACTAEEGGRTAFRSGWVGADGTAAQDLARAAKAFLLGAEVAAMDLTTLDDQAGLSGKLAGDARIRPAAPATLPDPAVQVAIG